MTIKRLRCSKTFESEKLLRISDSVKEQLYTCVQKQFKQTSKLPAEYTQISDSINLNGYLMLRTGYRLSELGKAIHGIYDICPEKCNLNELLTFLTERVRPYFAENKWHIKLSLCKESVSVNVDKEKLCCMIIELLFNAIENSPFAVKIKIALTHTKKFAKISVYDKGRGLDRDVILHCFEPFFSTHNPKNKAHLGIGLALAKYFALKSDGRICCSSSEEKGSCFSLYLPIEEIAKAPETVSIPSPDFDTPLSYFDITLSGIENCKKL